LYYNILISSPAATIFWWDRRFRLSPPHLDFFSACDEFPGGLCLVGQVENLRAGWQPALSRTRLTARFLLPASAVRRHISLRLFCSVGQLGNLARAQLSAAGDVTRQGPSTPLLIP
jgi:hypothetical protein